VVFNLVEAVNGQGVLGYLGASLCEALALPYTGNTSAALQLSTHKVWTKQLLRDAGLATPDWWTQLPATLASAYILKSVTEDASIGITSDSVTADTVQLEALWQDRQQRYGGAWFIERYIPGREFNVSLLQTVTGVEVLPIAEMRFSNFPPDRPQIVDYAAKWEPDSPTAQCMARSFEFSAHDTALLQQLRTVALRAWQTLALRGYARVDFRVDALGQPWVLEINANPCLDPEVGFAQAALQAGWDYPRLIQHLLHLAAPTLKQASAPTAYSQGTVTWRHEVVSTDVAAVLALVQATDVFTPEECRIAAELVQLRLQQGTASGYEFILAQQDEQLVGYACFGAVPAAAGRFDLYWIAVAPKLHGTGLATLLLTETLATIAASGGVRVYAETSTTARYAPARAFYTRHDFALMAVLPDFYADGDGKAFYQREIN
jgi:D-alanine-D-alanine ligase